jgi:hypothetical protein
MSESILLYRFLSAEAAIKTIEMRSFRVGRLLELNDPYEWLPGIDGIIPEALEFVNRCMDNYLKDMNEDFGMISFSETVSDTVLWSHYADSHRGIAIEVDHLVNDQLHKVTYSHIRPTVPVHFINQQEQYGEQMREILLRSVMQKSLSWSYEKEYRVLEDLTSCQVAQGMYFLKIPENFVARVIIGARSTVSPNYVRRALEINGLTNVQVVKARRSIKTYDIEIE